MLDSSMVAHELMPVGSSDRHMMNVLKVSKTKTSAKGNSLKGECKGRGRGIQKRWKEAEQT